LLLPRFRLTLSPGALGIALALFRLARRVLPAGIGLTLGVRLALRAIAFLLLALLVESRALLVAPLALLVVGPLPLLHIRFATLLLLTGLLLIVSLLLIALRPIVASAVN